MVLVIFPTLQVESDNAARSEMKYYYCPVSPRLINLDPSDPFKGSFSD